MFLSEASGLLTQCCLLPRHFHLLHHILHRVEPSIQSGAGANWLQAKTMCICLGWDDRQIHICWYAFEEVPSDSLSFTLVERGKLRCSVIIKTIDTKQTTILLNQCSNHSFCDLTSGLVLALQSVES